MRNIVTRFTSFILVLTVGSGLALAQYGGGGMGGTTGGSTSGGGYTAPKSGYGSGAAIGIGIGAAAGVAGLTYWMLHKRPTMVGCVQPSSSGNALLNEKDGKLYQLLPDSDVTLKPGERVALKGKKTADTFEARALVKDYGACETSKVSSAETGTVTSASNAKPEK